ncbi:pyridoxal-dependent decarboxylase [Dactylosporangium sp. AC04546]|uniref:pyridoxal phosphate-dependent decarboxylase family protein n=1 Tax=Dactylosporangium sp. AC04546 TaxID=2862460 RepID=UPI001EE07254|nr:pyridoxal-dependent decarboxylase [Dactylosporangium sp. AC04546]WVK87510.1 pyridoxal-dependent decarboxylase [Dactylosporangium sp. AC04546]
MADPLHERDEALPALRQVYDAAGPYLDGLAERLVHDRVAEPLLDRLGGPLPETGRGTAAAVEELLRVGTATATASAGPRFFHFVIGGSTPAALAADWVVSLLDQNAFVKASSRFADAAERVALDWLRQLFGLPAGWGGALTASATFANVAGLTLATHWWAERHGADLAADGLAGLPRMPVLATRLLHPSARKALQLIGHGKDTAEIFDAPAELGGRLRDLGAPAVIIATAGEPNAGAFDSLEDLAELAEQHGAWLHVDGAFGLFAALSPRTAHLTAGVERADSVAADAHKWLNVPYESGFVLVRDPSRLGAAFGMPGAPYLPGPDDPRGGFGLLGPESSRRARALPIWATLAAYGRDGYRAMVERHCDLARHLAAAVDAAPDLERLAEVPLNVVCFRYRPPGLAEPELDALNRRLAEELLDDGRVYAGGTVHEGRAALRPAISNWRTTEADLDLLVAVVRELGAKAAP